MRDARYEQSKIISTASRDKSRMTYESRITVMQVFAAMGLTPTNNQSWAVGLRAQAEYAKEFSEQPPKDNRPKTSGKGVHCFALYPATWRSRIEVHIRAVMDAERNQGDMF